MIFCDFFALVFFCGLSWKDWLTRCSIHAFFVFFKIVLRVYFFTTITVVCGLTLIPRFALLGANSSTSKTS